MTSIRILGRLAAALVIVGIAAHGGSLLAADTEALRALDQRADGSPVHGDASLVLVTLDATPPQRPLPDRIVWAPAARWLLEGVD